MLFRSLAIAALPAVALAADQVALYLGDSTDEGFPMVVTILNVQGSATSVRAACPTDVDFTECGIAEGIDFTVWGSTSFLMTTTYGGDETDDEDGSFTASIDCSAYATPSGTVGGICTTSVGGSDVEDGGVATQPVGTQYSATTVSVAAGASLLTSTPTSTASSSGSKSTSTGSSTGTGSSTSGVAKPTGSGNSTNSTDEGVAPALGPGSGLLASVGIVALSGVFAVLL